MSDDSTLRVAQVGDYTVVKREGAAAADDPFRGKAWAIRYTEFPTFDEAAAFANDRTAREAAEKEDETPRER